MAKFSFVQTLTVTMVFSALVLSAMVIIEANATQKCIEVLYPSGCTPEDCRQKCFQKHNDMRGQCISNVSKTVFACSCIWNCAR
ncbi:unnamed protein product [Linum tenue]|uniref:Uncharacterized protein n=1 Tax=Linum tenue TaxID=586396 RepID=A0AAV0JC04_9ROSI|nr:unnamed protein product [Linum tenue]